MPKRLLSLFLLLTILVPTSLFGASLHRCRMMGDRLMENAGRPSCCSHAAPAVKEKEGSGNLSHRCDINPAAMGLQPVTVTYHPQLELYYPAEFVPAFVVTRPPSDLTSRFSSAVLHCLSPGNGPPVFLRNCSFLI
jgi:hypothetical protein